jgi:hypothetical protein
LAAIPVLLKFKLPKTNGSDAMQTDRDPIG